MERTGARCFNCRLVFQQFVNASRAVGRKVGGSAYLCSRCTGAVSKYVKLQELAKVQVPDAIDSAAACPFVEADHIFGIIVMYGQ